MRKTVFKFALICTFLLATASIAMATTYKCSGNRIEKGSSTWGYYRDISGGYRIEKGSSTIAYVVKRGSKWAIETSGRSTIGWLNGSRIEKSGGSSWAYLSDAKRFCDGPDAVAAAMWVLDELGKI